MPTTTMTKQELVAKYHINTMGQAMDTLASIYFELIKSLASGPITIASQIAYNKAKEEYVSLCVLLIHHPNTTPQMRSEIDRQLRVLKYKLE